MGWCISDTEDSEVIEIFLSRIKARSPTTTVRVVMTDDGKKVCSCKFGVMMDASITMFILRIILDDLVQRQFMETSSTFCVSGMLTGVPWT